MSRKNAGARDARRRTRAAISAAAVLAATAAFATPAGAAVNGSHVVAVLPATQGLELSGYPVGDTLNVHVIRNGVTIGSATGTTTPDKRDPNNGVLNIAGGAPPCWTGSTPQILPGDEVTVDDGGAGLDSTIVQNVAATTLERDPVTGHILVHGRGLDAELGGSVRLSGTLAKPSPVGAFSLRRGRLRILTTRLDFTRGNLTFAGDFRPELDFLATTQAGGATVGVAITGQASDPQFAFTSSPELPEDEVLSRLVFGTASGQLTTGQALALAQAAAQCSGGGDGAFERLRRSLGLGGLDVNLGASGGPSVGLERALNSRVSVGVKAGAAPAQTGVGVDIRVSDTVKV